MYGIRLSSVQDAESRAQLKKRRANEHSPPVVLNSNIGHLVTYMIGER